MAIAQLVRASDCGSEGRGFETHWSLLPHPDLLEIGVYFNYTSPRMNYWLLLIPLLTAATGWLTLQITLLSLFRPFKPRKILGFSLQGILPAKQHQIALKAGQIAAAEFSSFAAIEQKISDPRNMNKIKPLIETHIDDFLRIKLKDQMPMISMFIGDKTINTLKTVFMNEIEELFPR